MFSKRTYLRSLLPLAATLCLGGSTLPAQTTSTQSRIPAHPNLSARTRLSGHLTPWAVSANDAGTVPDATPLHLTLLLARTGTLQSAFDQLLADQQNPASPAYHQWLTPAQIGTQFGPTLDEIATVTQWLSSQGLQVTAVSPSRTFLDVTATAATASAAFATAIHQYALPGDTQTTRLAATTAPSIPLALAPVVQSIEGLTEIPLHPFHTVHLAETLTPLATSSSGSHYLFPGDFAKIYDIAATTSAGYDGTGIKIAIAGQSRITATDVTQLQSMAGLPAKAPNTILLPTSADPGLVKGDEDESTLDVTRAATVAPGTQVDLVIAANASGGVSTAIQYAVNTINDPILSISYGACETATNASSVQFYNTLFAQAAAQGITVLVSSGDSAAAGCSASFSVPTGKEVLAMGNYLCSSPYVTCVGGTEFADAGLDSTYWASANGANYTSALGYIPEGAWNEPTVTSSTGVVTYQIAGSGGGASAYIAKPTWQTGTGVPADGFRDIPDIAFATADHDGYFACLAYVGTAGDCSKGGGVIFSGTSASAPDMAGIAALLNQRLGTSQGNLNPLLYRLAASNPTAFHDATPASSRLGTCSTATPSLCNNSTPARASLTGGLAGNPLQVGYDLVTGLGSLDVTNFLSAAAVPLAASTITLTTPTTTVPAGQTLAITAAVAAGTSTSTSTPTGTIQFSSPAFPTATVALASATAATTAAFPTPGTYPVTASYSGDANFTASTATPISITVTAAATTTTLTLSSNLLTTGASATFSAKVTPVGTTTPAPTGTIQFYANGNPIGSPATLATATATSAPIPFATNGTYAITALYSGDANNLTSTSTPATLTVAASGTTVTTLATPATTLVPGSPTTLTARITGNTTQTPTGTVQFMANSTPLAPALTLSGGAASMTYSGFPLPGNYALAAVYSGDTNNLASTSPATPVVVSKYTTVVSALTASAVSFSTAQSTVLKVTLAPPASSAPAPTGAIQLYSNNAALGSPIPLSGLTATSPALTFPTAGTYTITAVYTGDTSYAAINLPGLALSVVVPTIAVAPSASTIAVTSGATTGNTSILTVSSPNGFSGPIALTCAITSTPASAVNPPTCSLSPATLTLASASASATTTLSLATTVPHSTPATITAQSAPTLLPFALAGLPILLLPLRRRALRVLLPCLLLLSAATLTLSGCSANVSSSATTIASSPILVGTTTGAYTVTVTATPTGAAPVTTTLTLTVQ